MEARILRPLWWFGLLEARSEERSATDLVTRRLYRKTPLFDRFVAVRDDKGQKGFAANLGPG